MPKNYTMPQAEKGEVIFELWSGYDDWKRAHFALLYLDENAPIYEPNTHGTMIEVGRGPRTRGQHFFGDPKPYLDRHREAGMRVRYIDCR